MKTMLSVDGEKIIRVSDEKSSKLYEEGFRFVPKSMWKEQVRDVDKPTEDKPTKKKNNRMSRATKRHLRKSNNK
jgi:hypothetical protein